MKVVSMILIVTLTSLASGLALAVTPPACEQIQNECGEAGFTRDLPAGRDLMTKCYEPLLKGQDVPGVKVDSDLVKTCNLQLHQKPKRANGARKRRSQSSL